MLIKKRRTQMGCLLIASEIPRFQKQDSKRFLCPQIFDEIKRFHIEDNFSVLEKLDLDISVRSFMSPFSKE